MTPVEIYEQLGPYTVLERLGKGGKSVVHRAHHDEIGDVAIKLLPGVTKGARGRLLHEAGLAASLDHPWIIKVYGIGEHRRRPYIVMELLRGATLKAMIRDGEHIGLERRIEILKQVIDALAYAHEAGVAHRDVKPQNIFVTHDGSVRVLDFGLARATDAMTNTTGGLVGTPAYVPPEQLLGHEVDNRGDIFSTGVVFYELLTETRAFRGGTMREVLERVTRHDPDPVHQVDARMPEELSTIVQTAMAKNPEERFQSMREMLAAVQRFENNLGALRDEMRHEISAQLARLGPLPADDRGPPGLRLPFKLADDYLELVAARQRMEEQRERFEELVQDLAWVTETLAAPLEPLDDEALQAIANRNDRIRDEWPSEPRVAELANRVLEALRARLKLREPVKWGNVGHRPGKDTA